MINQKLITEVGRSQRVEVLTTLKRSAAGGLSVRELAARFGMSYMGVKQHCLALERDGYVDTLRRRKPVGRPELIYRLTPLAHALFNRQEAGHGGPRSGPVGAARMVGDLLDAVRRTYGPAAGDKLLFSIYARWADDFRARLSDCEDLPERVAGLARLRDEEGYMASVDPPPTPATATANAEPVHGGQNTAHFHGHVTAAGARIFLHAPPVSWTRAGAGEANGTSPKPLRILENQSPLEDLLRTHPIIARLERELFERVLGCPVQRTDESVPGVYRCVFEVDAAG